MTKSRVSYETSKMPGSDLRSMMMSYRGSSGVSYRASVVWAGRRCVSRENRCSSTADQPRVWSWDACGGWRTTHTTHSQRIASVMAESLTRQDKVPTVRPGVDDD
jgi:hypothetical protein